MLVKKLFCSLYIRAFDSFKFSDKTFNVISKNLNTPIGELLEEFDSLKTFQKRGLDDDDDGDDDRILPPKKKIRSNDIVQSPKHVSETKSFLEDQIQDSSSSSASESSDSDTSDP